MAPLREGSESLTSSLLQAQAELDQIGHRLEQEFSSRYRDSEVNPLVVLNRLHKLRRCRAGLGCAGVSVLERMPDQQGGVPAPIPVARFQPKGRPFHSYALSPRDISAVAEDAEDLAGTRDTLAAELSGLLSSNVAKLHALQRKAGIHPSLELPGVPA